MRIRLKSKKMLHSLFYQEKQIDADKHPLTFERYVMHIKESMFGNWYTVVDASVSQENRPFFAIPDYFMITDGERRWCVANKFVWEIDL